MIELSKEKQETFLRASLSDRCNYSCEYCAKDLGMENHTPKEICAPVLTAEEYIDNLRCFAEHGFKTISFTGGEPLLCKDFEQIARKSRELFQTMEITTNGSYLLDKLDFIGDHFDRVKISVDAVDANLRVKIARNPDAKNTLAVIEECCRYGLNRIGLNFVYMKQNAKELPKLVEFGKRMKDKYSTNLYISVLDLYYSKGNNTFWKEQFLNLYELRDELQQQGIEVSQRIRVGCDSYYCFWDSVLVTMKDSMSCTHRSSICENCKEYCQEGIYSLKHSASGWISVCPSNNVNLGILLREKNKHECIDYYIKIINEAERIQQTSKEFIRRTVLNEGNENESDST